VVLVIAATGAVGVVVDGAVVDVTVGQPAATVMLSTLVAVSDRASSALMVKMYDPAWVGVPLRAPKGDRVRPGGPVPAGLIVHL
jgi:hypothetical protein